MKRPRLVLAGVLWLANWYSKRQQASEPTPQPDDTESLMDSIMFDTPIETAVISAWQPPASAAPYLDQIHQVENENGIPRDLLTRLLYQESRFRPDIISGEVVSSAGALGIAQIVPRWHPGVDPLNPSEAIPYAGNYLAELHDQFDTWPMALAAYNWGPGNLRRQGFQHAPLETKNYVAQIMGDLGDLGDLSEVYA